MKNLLSATDKYRKSRVGTKASSYNHSLIEVAVVWASKCWYANLIFMASVPEKTIVAYHCEYEQVKGLDEECVVVEICVRYKP